MVEVPLRSKSGLTKGLPVLDILALAATGSEMDCGGVISNPDTKDKIGLLFPVMQPKVSFLDPTLTYSVNSYQTACGAADMLSHVMEHELSAIYDITHGLGLAILTPRWMEYTLDETTVSRFYQFGCNVFGIEVSLPQMEVAKAILQRWHKKQ